MMKLFDTVARIAAYRLYFDVDHRDFSKLLRLRIRLLAMQND